LHNLRPCDPGENRACLQEFPDDEWDHISEEAKHLISAMLTVEPTNRLNIEAALAHPWMRIRDD